MGNGFLKQLEAARFILFVLDPFSEFSTSLKQGWQVLQEQLKNYSQQFLNIPCAVAVNKMDLPEAQSKAKAEKFKLEAPVFFISAQSGEGLEELKKYLKQAVLKEEHS